MNKDLSLFKVFMSPDVVKPVGDVLLSGYVTQGPKVAEFEQKLSKTLGAKYVLALNSATSGLTLAHRVIKDRLGAEAGDEVLSCPLTCMATNLPILACGLKIKWVDVDPKTCNICLNDLERKITKKTKAITFVHWGGYPVDLNAVSDILDRKEKELGFRPMVVEDCAHGFLAEYKGKKIGSHGNFAVFSTQAIKHLTTGDGGVIVCPDLESYEKVKLLRWYGIDREKRSGGGDFRLESDVKWWGYKFHMNDINATIGLANLPHISGLVRKNRENAAFLTDKLGASVELLHKPSEDFKSAYWLFSILVDDKPEFIKKLKEDGIMASQVHQRNDIHSCFGAFKTDLPQLDKLVQKLVCVPVGWWLEPEDLDRIAKSVVRAVGAQ